MKVFVKYCVLLLVAVIYLGQGIDSTRYLAKAAGQERLVSHEKDDFERLAMLTAMNAARSIISGTGDRESDWSVNTEKEYHEEAKEQKQ